MIKYIVILMNMLALLLVRVFFSADVSVKMNAPEKVKPGDEFTVSLTINKGSIAGVGHMKQNLPAGFGKAVVIEAKGAEFKYLPEDNVVKFTWISLPADQEFTISYKVTADASMPEGKVDLGGKFSYVLNNEKQTFEMPPASISVEKEQMASAVTPVKPETTATQPETTLAKAVPPDTAATKTVQKENPVSTPTTTASTSTTTASTPTTTASTPTTAPTETKPSYNVVASRTIVGSPEAGTEFTVEINVKKDGLKGFARVQETLPDGLVARALDNKGGTFSFADQKVKIIWDNVPADEDIKVSYRVAVGEKLSGDMSITGSFSYVENDDPKKAEIPATTISVKAGAPVAAGTPTTEPTAPSPTTAVTANAPAPETKVNFKIQICALSKLDRSTSYFEGKFALSSKVSMEFHEGWRKYVTGKYTEYKDARDYRETVRSKGVENPFVTAYNNGKRITVQEGLMVASQKWVP